MFPPLGEINFPINNEKSDIINKHLRINSLNQTRNSLFILPHLAIVDVIKSTAWSKCSLPWAIRLTPLEIGMIKPLFNPLQ